MSFQLNFTHQGATHDVYLEKGTPSKESVIIGGKVFKLLGSEGSISLFKSYIANPEKVLITISPTWKASLESFGPYGKTEDLFQETVSKKSSSESSAVQKAQNPLTEAQITRLNKVISKAAFLFEMDEAQIREILALKKHQETLSQALEVKIARVVFPGEKEDPTQNGEYILLGAKKIDFNVV